MGVRVVRGPLVSVCVACVLVFASCGGSDSGSSDVSTADSASVSSDAGSATGDSVVEDSAARLELFCADAQKQAGTNLAEADDATAIAKKLADNAATLAKLAVNSPDEVKDSVTGIATAAKEMADAVAADPSLANINDVVQKYSTPDFDASSKKVEEFIKTNCGE